MHHRARSSKTGKSVMCRRLLVLPEDIWEADHWIHFGMLRYLCIVAEVSLQVRAHKYVKDYKEVEQIKLSSFVFFWAHPEFYASGHITMPDWWCDKGDWCWECLPASLLIAGLCRPHMHSCSVVCLPAFHLLQECNARHTSDGSMFRTWREATVPHICELQAPKAVDEDRGQINKAFQVRWDLMGI